MMYLGGNHKIDAAGHKVKMLKIDGNSAAAFYEQQNMVVRVPVRYYQLLIDAVIIFN